MGMVGEACLPSNAYYPRIPDYTFYFGVNVIWSERSILGSMSFGQNVLIRHFFTDLSVWIMAWVPLLKLLIRFARASLNLSAFNCRNKALTAKLLRQGYRYLKLR